MGDVWKKTFLEQCIWKTAYNVGQFQNDKILTKKMYYMMHSVSILE